MATVSELLPLMADETRRPALILCRKAGLKHGRTAPYHVLAVLPADRGSIMEALGEYGSRGVREVIPDREPGSLFVCVTDGDAEPLGRPVLISDIKAVLPGWPQGVEIREDGRALHPQDCPQLCGRAAA